MKANTTVVGREGWMIGGGGIGVECWGGLE